MCKNWQFKHFWKSSWVKTSALLLPLLLQQQHQQLKKCFNGDKGVSSKLFQGTCTVSATTRNKTGPSFYTSSLLIHDHFQLSTLGMLMEPEVGTALQSCLWRQRCSAGQHFLRNQLSERRLGYFLADNSLVTSEMLLKWEKLHIDLLKCCWFALGTSNCIQWWVFKKKSWWKQATFQKKNKEYFKLSSCIMVLWTHSKWTLCCIIQLWLRTGFLQRKLFLARQFIIHLLLYYWCLILWLQFQESRAVSENI